MHQRREFFGSTRIALLDLRHDLCDIAHEGPAAERFYQDHGDSTGPLAEG